MTRLLKNPLIPPVLTALALALLVLMGAGGMTRADENPILALCLAAVTALAMALVEMELGE